MERKVIDLHWVWNRRPKLSALVEILVSLTYWKRNFPESKFYWYTEDAKVPEVCSLFNSYVDDIRVVRFSDLDISRKWPDWETISIARKMEAPGVVMLNTLYPFPREPYVFSEKYIVRKLTLENPYNDFYYSKLLPNRIFSQKRRAYREFAGFYYFPNPMMANIWAEVAIATHRSLNKVEADTKITWPGVAEEKALRGSCFSHICQEVLYTAFVEDLHLPYDDEEFRFWYFPSLPDKQEHIDILSKEDCEVLLTFRDTVEYDDVEYLQMIQERIL